MAETDPRLRRYIAEVLAGLQVPISLGMSLGTARDPWEKAKDALGLFGWNDADQYEAALVKYEQERGDD